MFGLDFTVWVYCLKVVEGGFSTAVTEEKEYNRAVAVRYTSSSLPFPADFLKVLSRTSPTILSSTLSSPGAYVYILLYRTMSVPLECKYARKKIGKGGGTGWYPRCGAADNKRQGSRHSHHGKVTATPV